MASRPVNKFTPYWPADARQRFVEKLGVMQRLLIARDKLCLGLTYFVCKV